MGSRSVALILIATGVQLGAFGGIAAATAGDAAPTPQPSVTDQLASEAPPAAPPAPPPERPPAAGQGAASSTAASPASVTISRAGSSSTRTVSIVDFVFDPTALSVKVGDSVQWINSGTAEEGHNVIGDGLQSPVLHTGESYSFTFTTAGTFSYVCTIHPKMTGTVEVIDPNADQPGKTKKPRGGKRGNSSANASAGGGGSSGSGSASGPSESSAGRSSSAAGTSGSLPSTGSDSFGLTLAGLLLVALGLALRSPLAERALRRD